MARALMGSHYEPLDGEPAGMTRVRQQIFADSRELIRLRQQCDVLWMKLLGLRGELEALVTGARESAACPTSSSAVPVERSGNAQGEVGISSSGDWGKGNPPVYQTIAYLRESAVRADGHRRPEQPMVAPPGMAPVVEVVGSVRSTISGIGAVLPRDSVNLIRGIYIRGLDFKLTERQVLLEFSRFGEITAVSFPRDGQGRPAGYAMIEYGNSDQAAAAIFGMHGWCMGDRELEVTLMHRRIVNANTRGSFGPRTGSNVWNTGD